MNKKSAFLTGFWQGLGAPALLFSEPAPRPLLPEIRPLYFPGNQSDDAAAIKGDWNKVGVSLKSAMSRYEAAG
jgi:hypothetical protein